MLQATVDVATDVRGGQPGIECRLCEQRMCQLGRRPEFAQVRGRREESRLWRSPTGAPSRMNSRVRRLTDVCPFSAQSGDCNRRLSSGMHRLLPVLDGQGMWPRSIRQFERQGLCRTIKDPLGRYFQQFVVRDAPLVAAGF